MEVPCSLLKEQGCKEKKRCTKAIKDACPVPLTKQFPPGHRSFWIASQKPAKPDHEPLSWETPNCLIEHKTSLPFHPRYPFGAKLT